MSHITNVQDPNFPLIQLPAQFSAQRHTMVDRQAGIGESIEVFRAQGPGCIRHIWIVPNPISDTRFTPDYIDNSNTNAIIKIYVDDDPRPLVNMDLKRLCGVLLDQSPYRVDNAGFAVLAQKDGVGARRLFQHLFADSVCQILPDHDGTADGSVHPHYG